MTAILPKIEQLSPRIIRILGCNPGPMTLQGTNTYLIGSGEKRVLIDAGEQDNKEYISSLTGVLKEQRAGLSDVIITHWHHDHIGGLCNVLSATNKDAVVHKLSCSEPPDAPLPGWVRLRPLQHLQEVAVAGAALRAHHTPGHSSDHMVLEMLGEAPDCGVFAGDCILGEGTTVFEDLFEYIKSLELLLSLNCGTIYPGHGPVISDGPAAIKEYISHRNSREQQIMAAVLDGPASTPHQLVKVVYKATPSHLHAAAEVNLRHHLSKLLKEGKVSVEGDSYTATVATHQHKL